MTEIASCHFCNLLTAADVSNSRYENQITDHAVDACGRVATLANRLRSRSDEEPKVVAAAAGSSGWQT